MPSKGVDYYSFIQLPGTTIKFSGPKVGSTTTANNNWSKNHLEIDSSNMPGFTGTFEWDILLNNQVLYSRKQDISSLTGNLGSGDFTNMMNTPAVVGSNYTITYGFYDAGSGQFGLPNADQAWVTIIPKLNAWMGNVAPVSSVQANQPFSTFVLAAAHDAGMNTMSSVGMVTLGTALQVIIAALVNYLPIPNIAALLAKQAPVIMEDLAMTQKDTFTSMLNNGVRYFDFRPAYLLPGLRTIVPSSADTLYHTHLVIPGARFDGFLNEVVQFLVANPTEIAVVRTCSDGIKECQIPDPATITLFANNALKGTNLKLGDRTSFQTSIATLRSQGTRLILVQENPKYDSYFMIDGAYNTLDPKTIIASFNKMTTAGQANSDFTVLQCQGTAEGIPTVLGYGAAAANGSTSPLMATKAQFDMATLPWLKENALKKFTARQNIIIMNDFVDGATTYTAYQLSQASFAFSIEMGKQVKAQADLEAYRAREELLKDIVADQTAAMKASESITKDDVDALDVFKAARNEAEAVRKAQEQEIAMIEKQVAALSG